MIGRTISDMATALRAGDVSSADLTEAALSGIARLDDRLRAFVVTDPDGAQAAAADADAALAAGNDRGPLVGVPVAVKDIIDMQGLPTRCGSPAYPEVPSSRDASVVSRLRSAGAVIVGKTTAHELACGVYSPPAVNPWDVTRLPGGSSGGSGGAVAAGLVAMALGSDTGGSIRIPAAVCGVTGLKPTYGRVSRHGVEPLSWSLDHIGPLAASVRDCALSLGAMAGADPADPSTAQVAVPDFAASLDRGVDGLRVGVLTGPSFSPMAPDVERAFLAAVDHLRSHGAEPVTLEIPELEYTLAAEFAIVGAEAAHYHRRLLREQPDRIDPGIRTLLVTGTLRPAADYLKGLSARTVVRDAIRRTFEEHRLDVVATPTLPETAGGLEQTEFEIEGAREQVTSAYVRTTAPFNLSGLPALSVPCGIDGNGLPIGLQLAGRPFAEETVLQVGAAYESTTTWSQRRPPIHVAAA